MSADIGTSTNSLLEYAARLEKSTPSSIHVSSNKNEELLLLEEIEKKGRRDHMEKKELRSRLQCAEERIKNLENLFSQQPQNFSKSFAANKTNASTSSLPNSPIIEARGSNAKPNRYRNIPEENATRLTTSENHSYLEQGKMTSEPLDLSTSISSGSPLHTSTRTPKSKSSTISTPLTISSSCNSTDKGRSQSISVSSATNYQSNTTTISNCSSKTRSSKLTPSSTITSSLSLSSTSQSLSQNESTTDQTKLTNMSPTANYKDSSIQTPSSSFFKTKSTREEKHHHKKPTQNISISPYSYEPTNDCIYSDSLSDVSSQEEESSSSSIAASSFGLNSSGTNYSLDSDSFLPSHQDHTGFSISYNGKNHITKQKKFKNVIFPNPNASSTTNEVIKDLEQFTTLKFREIDGIIGKINHKNERIYIKILQQENKKLKKNMSMIKKIIRAFSKKRELKKVDELFRGITEKELLEHIAIQFHDFLGSSDDISRQTAVKLVSRASKALKEKKTK